jgi:hypothetical protein
MSILSSTNSGSYTGLTHEYIMNKHGDKLFCFGAEGNYRYQTTPTLRTSYLEQNSKNTHSLYLDMYMPYLEVKNVLDLEYVLFYWEAKIREEKKWYLHELLKRCRPINQFGEDMPLNSLSAHSYRNYIKENNIVCQF